MRWTLGATGRRRLREGWWRGRRLQRRELESVGARMRREGGGREEGGRRKERAGGHGTGAVRERGSGGETSGGKSEAARDGERESWRERV
jgi:hypothetical protein